MMKILKNFNFYEINTSGETFLKFLVFPDLLKEIVNQFLYSLSSIPKNSNLVDR